MTTFFCVTSPCSISVPFHVALLISGGFASQQIYLACGTGTTRIMPSLAARRKATPLTLDLIYEEVALPDIITLSTRLYMYVNGRRLVIVEKEPSKAMDMTIDNYRQLCRGKVKNWPYRVLKQKYSGRVILTSQMSDDEKDIIMTREELVNCFYRRRNLFLVDRAMSRQSGSLMLYKWTTSEQGRYLLWQAMDMSHNLVAYRVSPPKLSQVALRIAQYMVDHVSKVWATAMCSACNHTWHRHTCTNLNLIEANVPFILDYCRKNIFQLAGVARDISNQLYGDDQNSFHLYKSVSLMLGPPKDLDHQSALTALVKWAFERNVSVTIRIVETSV